MYLPNKEYRLPLSVVRYDKYAMRTDDMYPFNPFTMWVELLMAKFGFSMPFEKRDFNKWQREHQDIIKKYREGVE